MKKGGSDINQNQPFFRNDSVFPKVFKMDTIMKSIYYCDYQRQWEKNVKEAFFISLDGCRTHGLVYCATKKIFTIDSRDFFEKSFMFSANGKIYKYSSNADWPEKDPSSQSKDKRVRGTNLHSCSLIQRLEDGRILYTNINQMDYKLNIPLFIKTSFLPKAAKTWYKDITAFLLKQHKQENEIRGN